MVHTIIKYNIFHNNYGIYQINYGIDESKHYVTNQYHPERYSLYLIAGKYSGWQ